MQRKITIKKTKKNEANITDKMIVILLTIIDNNSSIFWIGIIGRHHPWSLHHSFVFWELLRVKAVVKGNVVVPVGDIVDVSTDVIAVPKSPVVFIGFETPTKVLFFALNDAEVVLNGEKIVELLRVLWVGKRVLVISCVVVLLFLLVLFTGDNVDDNMLGTLFVDSSVVFKMTSFVRLWLVTVVVEGVILLISKDGCLFSKVVLNDTVEDNRVAEDIFIV